LSCRGRLTRKIDDLQFLLIIVTLFVGLAIGTSIAAYMALAPCVNSGANEKCDIDNWQALLLEGIGLGGGLGSYFYYLQRKNTKRIDDVIKRIDEREKMLLPSGVAGSLVI